VELVSRRLRDRMELPNPRLQLLTIRLKARVASMGLQARYYQTETSASKPETGASKPETSETENETG